METELRRLEDQTIRIGRELTNSRKAMETLSGVRGVYVELLCRELTNSRKAMETKTRGFHYAVYFLCRELTNSRKAMETRPQLNAGSLRNLEVGN